MTNSKSSRLAAVVALSLSLALSGCGGGGGGAGSSSPAGGGGGVTPPITPQAVSFKLQLSIGGSTASATQSVARSTQGGSRKPMYVSPSINGTYLTITSQSTGLVVSTTTTDVSATSSNCVPTGGGGRTCTIPITIPSGVYIFTLKTYDAAPVGGSIPGTAKQLSVSTVTQNITAFASNTITFLLSAIVTGTPGVTCTSGCSGNLTYFSLPSDGLTHNFGFAVSATDGDGNVITGSVPFSSPISVTLTETGGSGHSQLILNGTAVGTTASITKANDTLALRYDGAGSAGYTTTTNIGGHTTVISPMYLAPASSTITKLSDSRTIAITEASAPGSIAYSATAPSCTETTGLATAGSGASATFSFNANSAAGTVKSCTITITDVDGTSMSYPISLNVSGPINCSGSTCTPTFPSGGSGNCSSGINFTAAGQTATFTVTDPNYSGSYALGNTTPATATASNGGGATVTITAVASGTTTVTVSDTNGNSYPCAVGVTTTSGTVQ